MAKWARVILMVLGAAVLIVFVVATDVRQGLENLARADFGRIAAAAALVLANVAVKTIRWRRMVDHFAAIRLRWLQAAAGVLAGVAAGSVSPARGIEFARPLLLRSSHAVGLTGSAVAVLVERLTDGIALAAVCGISLLLLPVSERILVWFVALTAAVMLVTGAVVLLLPDRMALAAGRMLARLPLAAHRRDRLAAVVGRLARRLLVWRHGRQLTALLVLALLAAMLEAVRVATVFAAMGVTLTVPEAMFAFGAANLVAIATFIPGGIGVTEASLAGIVGLLVPAAVARPAVAAAALVDRVLSYYLPVAIGGVILLLAPLASARATRKDREGTGTT